MKNTNYILAMVLSAAVFTACGNEDKQQEDNGSNDEQATIAPVGNGGSGVKFSEDVPDASPIMLQSLLVDNSMALTADERDCDHYAQYGLFGIPFGAACHIGPMVGELLYGKTPDSNGDGLVSCNDYAQAGRDQGVLMGMLCDTSFRAHDKIVAARWTDLVAGKDYALSFQDFSPEDDFDVTGSWSATAIAEGRYPANVSIYHGPAFGVVEPFIGMDLRDATNGEIFVDTASAGLTMKGQVKYSGKIDPYLCADDPSQENCHWQNISLVGSEAPGEGRLPPAMELRLTGDGKDDPTVVVVEGKIRLNEAWAEAWFSDDSIPAAFLATRTIYFQTIGVDGQAWGSFSFRDENGAIIEAIVDGVDLGKFIRDGGGQVGDGYCVNAGSDQPALCDKVDPVKYEHLFAGEEDLATQPADYELPITFPAAPLQYGFTQE